ncbi:MAG: HAMP domain-containing sensor histidine kinase [Kiritimatiellae bacterium]|nr:HAMP domain-containing sensor histidine kinase [Kiritimatiellia bacterium]MDD5519950.1 HAMP domain-containing sensor histidine kinase [Kiritimatiellia bacterium]
MKRRFIVALTAGMIIVLSSLFILSCNLNRRQYLANVQAIKGDLFQILNNETSVLRNKILTREREIFTLFDQTELPFDLLVVNRLFFSREGWVYPAGLPDVLPQKALEPDMAQKALSLGLELKNSGRNEKAREYFEAASRIAIKKPDDLNVKISAYVELLKASEYRNLRIMFSTLYTLFDYPGIKLDEIQTGKYENILKDNVSRYDEFKKQSREMWRTAEGIAKTISDHPAPLRALYENSILSVNVNGQAFLLPFETVIQSASNMVMRIGTTAPGPEAALSDQVRPFPIYTWIPVKDFEARKKSAERAYYLTNIMLGILLAVMAGMGIGIGIILKRQHEITHLKSSFVSTVSHELRTPLALIRLYAESLTGENRDSKTKERYTRAIMAETDRLSALVNNVLDFSRIEKGTLSLSVRETDVSKLCNEVLDSFSFRLEKEKITISRKIAPDLQALVDPLALTQVIFNLVDNAIKYSGENHKIEIEMKSAEGKIVLCVKDDGIGIPDSLKPRLFTPFVRGEDSRVTTQRGSGIGLSVTNQLLERMQCSIRIFDNVPAGTVFEILLPTAGRTG